MLQSRALAIGDLHFFDPNIILSAPRHFSFVKEMNDFMVAQWNSSATSDDDVFVLGDFFDFNHCCKQDAYDILDRLNGNIILIAGNHDTHLDYFKEYGLTVIEYPILKDNFWIMSHEPMFVTEAAPYANIFAHVHLNPMYKTVSTRSFCVSAERLNYKPIPLDDIKKMVMEYKEPEV
jgi:calcineurin-like phosphoesterase family protein